MSTVKSKWFILLNGMEWTEDVFIRFKHNLQSLDCQRARILNQIVQILFQVSSETTSFRFLLYFVKIKDV